MEITTIHGASYLNWMIEQILHTTSQIHNHTIRVAKNIQTKYKFVDLLKFNLLFRNSG